MLGGNSARRRGLILVLIAAVLWSSAGFFARLIDHLDVWTFTRRLGTRDPNWQLSATETVH